MPCRRTLVTVVASLLGLVGLTACAPGRSLAPTPTAAPSHPFASGEAVYFWRVTGDGSGGIYVGRGDDLPDALEVLNVRAACVGCHVVSTASGRIAAVLGTSNGPIAVQDLSSGRAIPIPDVRGSYLAWSPTGEQLAVSRDDADIYVLDLARGTLAALDGASDPALVETMPAWSPDGASIAFIRSAMAQDGFLLDGDSEIAVVPATGGMAQVLPGVPIGRNYYPAYSPDGKWMAFTHHATGDMAYASDAADVYLLPASGGAVVRLDANSDSSDSWASWSADGQWLAFNSKRGGQFDIYVTRIGPDGQSGDVIEWPGANTSAFEHLPAWGLPPEAIAEGNMETCTRLAVIPCVLLGLPWWAVPLLLFMLVPLAFIAWRWRRQEQSRAGWRPPTGYAGFPPPPSTEWPPLPSRLPPAPLSPVPRGGLPAPAETLVVGLGPAGVAALSVLADTIEEAYGVWPDGIGLLAVNAGPGSPFVHPKVCALEVNPDGAADRTALHGEDGLRPDWVRIATEDEAGDRSRYRLALWARAGEIRRRLVEELHCLSRPDAATTFFMLAAPAEASSALMFDLTHMARSEAEASSRAFAAFACLILDDSFAGADLQAREHARRHAFAAWRELDRFQFAFDHPYPFAYPGSPGVRTGMLFERVFLFSPDRASVNLTGLPPQAGLYPAMADTILCHLDRQARRAWEEVGRAADTRRGSRQRQLNEPLYASLGAFAYVLPMESLVEGAALRFAGDLLQAQTAPPPGALMEEVAARLARTAMPDGAPGGEMSHGLSQAARAIPGRSHLASLNAEDLAGLLVANRRNPSTETALGSLRALLGGFIPAAVRTSRDERSAPDGAYGPDTARLPREVDHIREHLPELDAWLSDCAEAQRMAFAQRMAHVFSDLLAPSLSAAEGNYGAARVVGFANDLSSVLAEQREQAQLTCQERERDAASAHRAAEESRAGLLQAARDSVEKCPSAPRALVGGLLPAAVGVLGLGLVGRLAPAFADWLWIPAGLGVVAGVWWSWRKAFPRQRLPEQQAAYLAAEQAALAAGIEARLYRTLAEVLGSFEAELAQAAEPFRQWLQMVTPLCESIAAREAQLQAARASRHAIRTRRYLDDPDLLDDLYRRHFDSARTADARSRLFWSRDELGRWTLSIVGAATQTVEPEKTDDALSALLALGRAHAADMRRLTAADVLAEVSPESIGDQMGRESTPLIGLLPHEQSEAEGHRFVFTLPESHDPYFDAVLARLQALAARQSSQRRAPLADPYRVIALASLDLLRQPGLSHWLSLRESYEGWPAIKRPALHVFSAECNAARFEAALGAIGLSPRLLSPAACLALEDFRRSRAFWLAFALGWIAVIERPAGLGSERCFSLSLSEDGPIFLTEPRDTEPSLWAAITDYVLSERGGPEALLEAALVPSQEADPREREDALREGILRVARRLAADAKTAELGLTMHLVLEDEVRRASGRTPIL